MSDDTEAMKMALTRLLQIGEHRAVVIGIEALIDHKIADMLDELSKRMKAGNNPSTTGAKT